MKLLTLESMSLTGTCTSVNHLLGEKRRKIMETDTANDQSHPTINSLPESILLLIFSSLDKVSDRCSVARTCRSWHRIVKDATLWKDHSLHETMGNFPTVRNVMGCGLSSCLLDLELSMSCAPSDFLYSPDLWPSFPNLEKLRTPNIDLYLFDFELLPPSLKTLTIFTADNSEHTYEVPWKTVKCSKPVLPNLEYLEIEDCQDVFANDYFQELHGLHYLLSSCKLHTVILKLMHYYFSTGSLSTISKQLQTARHVCLHSWYICDQGIQLFLSPLESVQILSLQFSQIAADIETQIVPCINGLKTLQEMYLSMFWELRPEHVKRMVEALPELKHIEVYRCRRIKREHLMEIEKMKEGLKCEFPGYMRLSML